MIKLFTALVATSALLAISSCQSVTASNSGTVPNKTSHPVFNAPSATHITINGATNSPTKAGSLRIDTESMVYSGSYQPTAMSTVTNPRTSSSPASSLQVSSPRSILQQPTPVSDTVITNYESDNALKMAKQNPELSIMVEVIEAAGIASMIRFAGSGYTVLAPNNQAFYKLFEETTLTKQLLLADRSLLRYLLSYHVIKTPQPLSTTQMQPSTLLSLNKKKLTINSRRNIIDERGRIAHIVTPNIVTKNGNVHIIDRVLFPSG